MHDGKNTRGERRKKYTEGVDCVALHLAGPWQRKMLQYQANYRSDRDSATRMEQYVKAGADSNFLWYDAAFEQLEHSSASVTTARVVRKRPDTLGVLL